MARPIASTMERGVEMKAEQELELLGKALGEAPEEETFAAAVNKLREELVKEFEKTGIPEKLLFGRKRKKILIIRPDVSSSLHHFAKNSKICADSLSKVASAAMDPSISASQMKEKLHSPPFEVTYMDSEITASDEELLAYFRGIMLQNRIDRMDLIERMTHAAASLSGRCHEEELHFFHVALRECGFRFNEGLIYYLRYFEWRLEHEAMPAQVSD